MIDFATCILGDNIMAISANIDKDVQMEYRIKGIKKLPSNGESVTCHKIPFPSAVYYCQRVAKTTMFIVTLMGTDGSKINAPAICHEHAACDSKHHEFEIAHNEVRSCPVCHFLLDDDVFWITK